MKSCCDKETISFQDLAVGEKARVIGYHASPHKSYRHRLLAIGLTPRTPLTVIRKSPLGDPVEILVRSSEISLRQKEANLLKIERILES